MISECLMLLLLHFLVSLRLVLYVSGVIFPISWVLVLMRLHAIENNVKCTISSLFSCFAMQFLVKFVLPDGQGCTSKGAHWDVHTWRNAFVWVKFSTGLGKLQWAGIFWWIPFFWWGRLLTLNVYLMIHWIKALHKSGMIQCYIFLLFLCHKKLFLDHLTGPFQSQECSRTSSVDCGLHESPITNTASSISKITLPQSVPHVLGVGQLLESVSTSSSVYLLASSHCTFFLKYLWLGIIVYFITRPSYL